MEFDVVFKKPVKNEFSELKYDRLWEFLIPEKVYHVVGIDEPTGGYILEFFDPQVIFEKEAFDLVN